ncbi:MAG: TrkA family potassium uptake protein [Candidatus Methanomethyliaceae archaeon]|nr:TrkA family potassium uptake protein [Candidatus Methanomethyliaceae archaeon]MDW7970558.1 TrkA family potassium uptake protein [Nitrososphaerota archaeon]
MKILIVGAGRVGKLLLKELKENGHDIAVMDINEDICKEISNEYDVLVFKGDVTNIDELTNVSPNDYEIFMCLTGSDEKNILGCLLAKELGVPRVIARVSDPRLSKIANKLGIADTVCPEEAAAEKILSLIRRYSGKAEESYEKDFIGVERIDIKVSKNAPAIGKSIEELPLKDHWMVLRIKDRNGKYIPFSSSFIIQPDYILEMIVKKSAVEAIRALFT